MKRIPLCIVFVLVLVAKGFGSAGDVDGYGGVDLADIVVSLQVAAGQQGGVEATGDVNGDGRIGLEEALYGLQSVSQQPLSYPVVDSTQDRCFSANGAVISCPGKGDTLYGQDAQYTANPPAYTISQDGLTVYDQVTGLSWTRSPDLDGDGDIDIADKLTYSEFLTYPNHLNATAFGGYDDWRLPTIKELYSLMDFTGTDPMIGGSAANLKPFIDDSVFAFGYGDESAGERNIDAQFWSSNVYTGTVFGNRQAAFGLNLADGRIKGYPISGGVTDKLNYVYFVRGNVDYGNNNFDDNGDGTITDQATGLMWAQADSGAGMDWEDALAYAQQQNAANYLGYSDWRLPSAKELQSIVDYSRAPDSTGSAAIDPLFSTSQITNEGGQVDYPWYWSSTTHIRADGSGPSAVYLSFGRATSYMHDSWLDVHGAGAQRSDQKIADFSRYTHVPYGYYFAMSPQGDAARIYNYVRLVRTIFSSNGASPADDE